ncbi:MAG: cell division protein FtsQ/DivIB [Halocynthiibacter sp.]
MQQVTSPRGRSLRDPAPSRVSYRIQRLWLTPVVRAVLRVGVPVFALILLVSVVLFDQGRRDAVGLWFEDVRRSIEERPEFMLKAMAIDGASDELTQDVREVFPIDFPLSSFDLDLEDMRAKVVDLDAVSTAMVHVRSGGILQVTIEERTPAIVWRGFDGVDVLDAEGHRISSLKARIMRPDLPLITGEGANEHVPEALALLAAAGPISKRIIGLVRVGERRWDIALDRDQRIMLPAQKPKEALARVILLHSARDLLARDVAVVDMRLPERPTLRLSETATRAFREIKALELGSN